MHAACRLYMSLSKAKKTLGLW